MKARILILLEEPTAICCNISVWELAITLNTVAAGTLGCAPGRKIVFLIRDETAGGQQQQAETWARLRNVSEYLFAAGGGRGLR